jgi:hypothetical protein
MLKKAKKKFLHQGLNCGPSDSQAAALPTELSKIEITAAGTRWRRNSSTAPTKSHTFVKE